MWVAHKLSLGVLLTPTLPPPLNKGTMINYRRDELYKSLEIFNVIRKKGVVWIIWHVGAASVYSAVTKCGVAVYRKGQEDNWCGWARDIHNAPVRTTTTQHPTFHARNFPGSLSESCSPLASLTCFNPLTLPTFGLLSSKAQECKDFWKSSKLCHVGIHWIALTEYSQIGTHLPGFQSQDNCGNISIIKVYFENHLKEKCSSCPF